MKHLLAAKIRLPIWRCPLCREGFKATSPCAECAGKFAPLELRSRMGFADNAFAPALFSYDSVAKKLIHAVKYDNSVTALGWLAKRCAERIAGTDIDYITWIPASRTQKQKRGYDQCRLLAESVSLHTRIPKYRFLRRLLDTPQTYSQNRHFGPSLKERGKSIQAVRGRNILLLDDVMTTGTSLRRGKMILESHGAACVHILAIAATRKARHPQVDL